MASASTPNFCGASLTSDEFLNEFFHYTQSYDALLAQVNLEPEAEPHPRPGLYCSAWGGGTVRTGPQLGLSKSKYKDRHTTC
jgi:hypothetical protein